MHSAEIEPALPSWKDDILPLNYKCSRVFSLNITVYIFKMIYTHLA